MKYLVLGAIASLSLVGVANAEGFDGPYAGAARASALSDLKVTSSGAATFKLSTYRNAFSGTDGEGWAGQVGYNTTFKGMLVGVELNYNGADGGRTYTNNPHTVTLTSTVDQLTDVRLRFGGDLEGNLLYLFGGVAQADASITAANLAIPANTRPPATPALAARSDTVSGTHSGAVFGGGVARKVTDKFSVFVEAAHYDLGDENYDFPAGSNFGTNTVKLTSTAFKVGANFHFK